MSSLLLCISLVGMKHMEMIGDLIRKLGLDPRYWRANRGYWNGSNVMYGDDTCRRLPR